MSKLPTSLGANFLCHPKFSNAKKKKESPIIDPSPSPVTDNRKKKIQRREGGGKKENMWSED